MIVYFSIAVAAGLAVTYSKCHTEENFGGRKTLADLLTICHQIFNVANL